MLQPDTLLQRTSSLREHKYTFEINNEYEFDWHAHFLLMILLEVKSQLETKGLYLASFGHYRRLCHFQKGEYKGKLVKKGMQ